MIAGLAVAGGGTAMLFKSSGRAGHDEARGDIPRPRPGVYLPVATVLAGMVIAYRAFSHYRADDAVDVATMFAFAFTLIFLLGLRLLVADRYGYEQDTQPAVSARPHQEPPGEGHDANDPDQSSAPL
jgi:hypothetical protein